MPLNNKHFNASVASSKYFHINFHPRVADPNSLFVLRVTLHLVKKGPFADFSGDGKLT